MTASHILERLARVVPPRAVATVGTSPWYAVATNSATAVQSLANTVFQLAGTDYQGNAIPGLKGNYGRALLRVQADGGDHYILFGSNSSVQANSAVVGAGASMKIPSGQERDFEVDVGTDQVPGPDAFMSVVTANGASINATARYGIVSFSARTTQQGT